MINRNFFISRTHERKVLSDRCQGGFENVNAGPSVDDQNACQSGERSTSLNAFAVAAEIITIGVSRQRPPSWAFFLGLFLRGWYKIIVFIAHLACKTVAQVLVPWISR